MYIALILLGVSLILFVFSLLFKIAGKLRLTIPLLYLLAAIIGSYLTDWVNENESLVLYGLYLVIALSILSWVFSLIKSIRKKIENRNSEEALHDFITWQLKKADELGIDRDTIFFDSNGNMHDQRTGKQIMF